MVSRLFIVLAFTAAVCWAQSPKPAKPECADEIHDFGDCLRTSAAPPKPDFEAIKKAADECFTNAGCTPPDGSHQKGPGGRAGPPPQSNDTCFRNVHQKLFEQFTACMKEKDPDFAKNGVPFLPGGGPPPQAGGPPPPPGGPPPFFGGPPPPFGGPPPPFGGPGGPQGGPPGGGGPPLDVLAKSCGDDQEKAKKAAACLKESADKHKPSKDEVKTHFDALCKAEPTCKAKLGKCEDTLKKKGQFACECAEQVHSKADEVFKAEESCKGKDKPPLPPADKKPDCSKPPPSPCEEGFDKFYERVSKFGPPPGDFGGPPPPPAGPPPSS